MRPIMPVVRNVTCGTAMLAATLILASHLCPVSEAAAGEPARPTATAEELRPRVEEFLRELDAPTRARREKALIGLRELGPRILPLLPAPDLLPSAAVSDAVKQLRGELERQQARVSIQASKVTLKGSRSVSEWIRELAQQSHNPLEVTGLPAAIAAKTLQLDVADVSFWTAIDQIGRDAGHPLVLVPGAVGMRVQSQKQPASDLKLPVVTSGAFRISAAPAQVREIFGSPDRELLRVPLQIQPEPRLRPLFLHYAAAEVTARVPGGADLPAMSPEAKYEVPLTEGGQPVSLTLDFVTQTARPRELSLQGKVWFTTAANQEPIQFTRLKTLHPARGREIARRRGGVTVALRKVTLPADNPDHELRVEVAVTYDTGGPAFESHRNWIMHNSVYLEAPDGNRFSLNGGTDTKLQADGSIGIEYRFVRLPDPLPDYAFVYVAPTLIIDAPVEIRLNSIPVQKL